MTVRFPLLALVFSAAAAAGCDRGGGRSEEHHRLVQRAMLAAESGAVADRLEAVRLLSEAMPHARDDVSLWIHRARALVLVPDEAGDAAGAVLEALIMAKNYARFDAFEAAALYLEGLAHEQRDEVDVAIERFRGSAERDPTCLEAWYRLGTLLHGEGRVDEAAAALARVAERDRGRLGADSLRLLHECHRKAGRPEEAEAARVRLASVRERVRGLPAARDDRRCRHTEIALLPFPRERVEPPAAALRFREAAVPGLEANRGRELLAVDFEGDGDPDLALLDDDGLRLLGNDAIAPGVRRGGARFRRLPLGRGRDGDGEEDAAPGEALVFPWDADADGDVDLLVAGAGATGMLARCGSGGVFARDEVPVPEFGRRHDGRFLDLDGDGALEAVVLATGAGATAQRARLVTLRREPDGRLAVVEEVDAGDADAAPRLRFAAAELDGEPGADLAVPRRDGAALFLDHGGDGPSSETIPGLAGHAVLRAGDLDNDGDFDLVGLPAASAPLRVAWNSTAESLAAGGPPSTRFRTEDIGDRVAATGARGAAPAVSDGLLADLDNDGDLDLVLAGAGGLSALRNERGGRFATAVRLAAAPVSRVVAADVDVDGLLDLLVLESQGGRLAVHLNESSPAHAVWRLRLAGAGGNAQGVGARVELWAGRSFQTVWLDAPAEARFGIGPGEREDLQIDGFRIVWPRGRSQVVPARLVSWDAHRRMVVLQGESAPAVGDGERDGGRESRRQ